MDKGASSFQSMDNFLEKLSLTRKNSFSFIKIIHLRNRLQGYSLQRWFLFFFGENVMD